MDLANVTKIFINTPLINNISITGVNPIGVNIPTKVEGSLSIAHTLNQGSEIRLSFTTVPSYRINSLQITFKEGSLHNYDNNQYITTNYSETITTQSLQQFGIISTYTVEVVLIVYSFLKAQLSVRLPFPSTGSPFISVQTIAAKTAVVYNGFDFHIPITRDNADSFYNFSLKQEIDSRSHEFEQFINYENNKIVTKPLQYSPPIIGTISPIQVSGSPPIQYKNAIITWVNNSLSPFRNDPTYLKPTPVVIYLVEGDLDVTRPPDNITGFKDQKGQTILSTGLSNPTDPKTTPLDEQSGNWYQATRVLHLVFDSGGQTKEVRITKKVDGVTEYVESYKYGFMFSTYSFASRGGSPSDYWVLIEYKKTLHQYTSVDRSFTDIKYQDRTGKWQSTIISPTLKSLLQASNVFYLTSTTTTGWRYFRFQTEQQGGWDIAKDTSVAGSIFWGKRLESGISGGTGGNSTAQYNYCQDMLQLYLFRKIPIYGKTQYYLVESESIYNDTFINTNKEVNANIEKVAWASLPEDLRIKTSPDSEGFVGIAKPDPDSYKEYMVISEKTEEIALGWRTNPLAKLYDSAKQTLSDKTPTVKANDIPTTYLPSLAPYVVGENTISTIERKVIPNRNTTSKYGDVLQENNRYKLPPNSDLGLNTHTYGTTGNTSRIDRYIEYNKTNTNRGEYLNEQAQITSFAEFEGRPPLATVKRTAALQSDIQQDPFYKRDKEHYYTSILDSEFPIEDSTASFSMLEIKQSELDRTRSALDFKLKLDNANSTQELTVNLGYYRPEYKIGSLTSLQEYDGQWLIRKVEHSFDFSGDFLVNKPTRLTLGKWHFIQSQITTSNFTKQPPDKLPYNPSKYNVVGGSYPLEFNKLPNTPSLTGDRGNEQPSLVEII